jgi:hypothetical protein
MVASILCFFAFCGHQFWFLQIKCDVVQTSNKDSSSFPFGLEFRVSRMVVY